MNSLNVKLPSPVLTVKDSRLKTAGVQLHLKRDDLIHPSIPGNKWRKLRLNLDEAVAAGHRTLLTFGGAYSNHIRAVASAGKLVGLNTIGLIRGEEHLPLNPTLEYARNQGMKLSYVDRTTYRNKSDVRFIESLHQEFGPFYLVPEGGSNPLGVQGCTDIAREFEQHYDLVVCPCGTGGTLAGLSFGLGPGQEALGIAVLKGAAFLARDVELLQQEAFGATSANWRIELDYHFGGFAKLPPALNKFADEFGRAHGLAVERTYVAKMLYAIFDMASNGRIPSGSSVLAVMTG